MNRKLVIIATSWVASAGLAYWAGSTFSPSMPDQGLDSANRLKLPTGSNKVSSKTLADETGAPIDASDPLAEFTDLTSGEIDWEAAQQKLHELRPWEAPEAIEALMLTPASQRRDRMLLDLLELWAEQNPNDALAYLENIQSMRLRDRATEQILETWGKNDPSAAMAWLNDNSADLSTRILNDRVLAVIEGFAQSDPSGAFNYAASLPGDTSAQRNLKQRALRESVQALVDADRVGEALTMTAALEDSGTQREVFAEIIGEWAEYDPVAASEYVNMLGPEAASEARRELMRSWADYDPVSAAAWLSELPTETEGTGQLVTDLVGRWTRYDLDASAAWLNQIPPSPEIDRAVAIYTYRSAEDDPATAMTWAESITRDDMRDRLMQRVASEWKQQDPTAFQSYLDDSSLSTEQKTQLENAQSWRGGGPPPGRWGRD